jgi:hypothetical protein
VACFLPVPDHLAPLAPLFESLDLTDKAKSLLTLHAGDGATYAMALTDLRDCQTWIQETP